MFAILLLLARSCPSITAPSHGTMSCITGQVTDGSCTFLCQPGFDLIGSTNRTCLPNQSWSGQMSSCSRAFCPSLVGPINSTVLYPCPHQYQDTCTNLCNAGYTIEGLGNQIVWVETCDLVSNSTGVNWDMQRRCIGIIIVLY